MFRVSPYIALIPVCLGVFVAADDQTVMVTVLPDIMFDFRIPPIELDYASWTITAYLLGYVAAMPLIGSMSDAFGHRRMFAIATVFFMICSVVAALSPSLPFLIGIRVFQAVGAGAMLPIAIAVVGDLFPRGSRGIALGIVGGSAEAGGVIGPLWGGLVARFLDWPWVFWMNVPLGALVLIALFLLLGPSPRFKSSLDYVGGFFIAVALASLTLALSRIDRLDLGMLGLLALTAVALIAFIYRQRTAAVTLLPNSMFRSRTVVMANVAHLMVGVSLIIGMVTIPIMTTYLIGHSPLEGGLRLMRMTVAMPFGAVLGGLACQRIDYRIPSVIGLILVAIGYAFMTTWDLSVADPQLTIHLALAGLGFGFLIAPIALGATEPVGHGDRGSAAAAVTSMRLVGMTLGLAAITAWGSQRFSLLVAGIPMPVPQEGEAIEVSRQRVAEFQETLTNIGMDVFVTFFAVAAVVAALGILPAFLMTWNRTRSRRPRNTPRPRERRCEALCRAAADSVRPVGEGWTVTYDPRRALELLRLGTQQPHAIFREGQEESIRHVVEGCGPLLLVQKTGWGKSNVYFIAAKLLREAGQGPALLISPLLALMRNQIEAAKRMSVRAATINSDNRDEWEVVEAQIRRDAIDVLLISPERLANERFVQDVLAPMSDRIALLVIDEAHCISDWGHDFRPDYRRIERIIGTLPPNLRLLGTTATANDRVLEDLRGMLGPRVIVQRGGLARPSLLLQTIRLPNQAQRLAWLAERLREVRGSGIIYTLTVRDAERVAAWLQSRGFAAAAYTGQTGDRRPEFEQALLDNRVKALAATTALGMGFDKPDLAFVFHYQAPGSVIHYYQQVGRAGRALDAAYGVLLSGDEDTDITSYFIRSAFPTRHEVAEVLGALKDEPDGLSVQELTHRANISPGRIRSTLKLLSLESPAPIALDGRRWQLVATELTDAFWERVERLTALRYREQAQMQEYVDLPAGHMEFLIDALDGESSAFTPPRIEPLSSTVDPRLVREAVAFLRRTDFQIEPRKRWPTGGRRDVQQRLVIPQDLQAESGRALCLWGDAGWGELVRHGKYQDQRFQDELVDACATLVREWRPVPAPMWVTAIPSRRRPTLVPDFAERLAKELGLPFHVVLGRMRDHQEQKEMENSAYQARNVWESLVVSNAPPPGPVLLVDDIVDSRWTMTVAAYKLRSEGSDEVFPMALTLAGGVA